MPELTWSSRLRAPDREAVRLRGRQSLDLRVRRLRRYGWHVAQCAVAAAVAWLVAHYALGHASPFFAPVAAIVSLGLSYGQRLRRGLEVTIGVALGVLIGDALALLLGTGGWQVLVVVATAMTVAVVLDGSPLLITQAGTQSAIVTTLAPSASSGLGRWLDAVCGGLVALVAAAVVPGQPLRRPRLAAAGITGEVSAWLADAATAGRDGDLDLAHRALARARASEPAVDDLRQAAREALDVARSSPWRRRRRGDMRAVADMAVPLDRAVRNSRVLLRRVVVVARHGERLPAGTVQVLDGLAQSLTTITRELTEQRSPERALTQLGDVVRTSARVRTGTSLSADVVLAQARSVVVDLMQVSGITQEQAEQRLRSSEADA